MSRVTLHFSVSLDGYAAGPAISAEDPLGVGGERLHDWLFAPERGEADLQVEREIRAAAQAVVLGRRTFDLGLAHWNDTPFPAPSFVLTHRPQAPLAQKSGTFTFVGDGIVDAIARGKAAAQGGGVIVMGVDTARQALRAGLVDEIDLQLAPIMLGGGERLFEGLDPEAEGYRLERVLPSPNVVHLRYLAGA
ncbi:dihydrofolate reductase [Luteimonas gilva]|uniref:Dihydrofolate reductase n=1 Tax=Luteimonas gilva TaxID=2572684 RepID=A0A4U5JWP1_9GAMM|nr:dihydrofolate reductase family protein [Luteimonas gilva]TKR33091.1 dihydrofolate reductase [Luteimonas gilva]